MAAKDQRNAQIGWNATTATRKITWKKTTGQREMTKKVRTHKGKAVREHLEVSQNTLIVSRGGVLS